MPANRESNKAKKNATSFKPGVSGNPVGRPKAATAFRDLARTHDLEAVGVIIELMKGAISESVRLAAAQLIIERAYGKAQNEAAVLIEERDIPDVLRQMSDEALADALRNTQ